MKQWQPLAAILLCAAMMMAMIPSVLAEDIEKNLYPSDVLRGDIDLNDVVNMQDTMAAYRHASGQITLPQKDMPLGDVDNSGEVNLIDALMLYRVSSSLVTWKDMGLSEKIPNPHIGIIDDPIYPPLVEK